MYKFNPFNVMHVNGIKSIAEYHVFDSKDHYTFEDIALQVTGRMRVYQDKDGSYYGDIRSPDGNEQFHVHTESSTLYAHSEHLHCVEPCRIEHYCGITAFTSKHRTYCIMDSMLLYRTSNSLELKTILGSIVPATPLFQFMLKNKIRTSTQLNEFATLYPDSTPEYATVVNQFIEAQKDSKVTVTKHNDILIFADKTDDLFHIDLNDLHAVFFIRHPLIYTYSKIKKDMDLAPYAKNKRIEHYFNLSAVEYSDDSIVWDNTYVIPCVDEESSQ